MRKLALLPLVLMIMVAPPAKAKVDHNCQGIRTGIVFYRNATWNWQDKTNANRYRSSYPERWSKSCRYLRWVADLWRNRSRQTKSRYLAWFYLPNARDWYTAVRTVQRVYPGTESWLLSCSGAEGGHGRWVRYGGGSYYAGYENTDAVGGWMQFRPSTFYPYARAAYADARRKGFIVPSSALSWHSPLGQALAAGYMRYVAHNTGWHWSASVGNGC